MKGMNYLMDKLNYISSSIIPIVIGIIVIFGVYEKKKVYDLFIDGAREGIDVVLNIFPTLVGIFIAIGSLRTSGVLDFIINIIKPVTNLLDFPSEVLPLALLRPISGSGAMGVATDIIKKFGVDNRIGLIAACIMGSTETTFYTIAVYTGCVKIKKIRFVLIASLIADLVGIIASVLVCNIFFT